MRILMATDFYPPFIGGAERQTYLLSKELTARGHQVSVATVWHEGLPERQEDSGVHVYRLKGMTTRVPWFSADPARRYHPPFPEPAIVLGLHRLIKRARPDVVHAGGWIAYSCAAALLGKRIPLLLSVRDYGYGCAVRTLLRDGRICAGPAAIKCLTHAAHVYRGPKAIAAVLGVFGGRALLTRRVDATHAISTYVQRTVARDVLGSRGRIPANRQVTIPDVVDGSLTGGDRARPIQRYLQELPAEPYILFVGALQEHKGVTVLLAAYQRLTAPPPLVLIGTVWPDTPRQYPVGVTVLHDVPHAAVMTAWERCLFGVAPSVWAEPLGDVTMEAMSKGKAIIGSAVGGHADIIVHGESGLLVPPGNVAALASAMQRLVEEAELRERLGRAGRERVRLFSSDAVVPRFEAVYRQVTDGPGETRR